MERLVVWRTQCCSLLSHGRHQAVAPGSRPGSGHGREDRRGAARIASQTTKTLQRAETLLSRVAPGTEPIWINRIGFGEPFPGLNLANSTAYALRDLGDLAEAEHQFKRSRATRDGVGHPRTYSLTLANLADVQFTRGLLPEACQNWSKSLDAMTGIRSARTDQAVRNLRSRLATFGHANPPSPSNSTNTQRPGNKPPPAAPRDTRGRCYYVNIGTWSGSQSLSVRSSVIWLGPSLG